MSTTNEIWLAGERLDLDDDTQLLPSFQANDRTKPDSIQSDYSPEFSVPGTARNHWLLKHAAAAQPAPGSAYVRMPAVLTAGGVETLPLALLYLKGYQERRYQLQLFGGNKRLVEALKRPDGTDKTLADLDLNRFNHAWTPANVLAGLPLAAWQAQGWGYEVYERGKPLDLQQLDPYTLYPSCSGQLVLSQILADAGFTATSLLSEPLAQALNVPSPNAFEFPQKFRDARQLTAGYAYDVNAQPRYYHTGGFGEEALVFPYTDRKPYHQPDPATGAGYAGGKYVAPTLGYYDLAASIPIFFGCNEKLSGKVRCKVMLLVNGQHIFDASGAELGKDEEESGKYQTRTFAPKLSRYLLHVGDTVELRWKGDEIGGTGGIGPSQPRWNLGPYGNQVMLPGGLTLASEVRVTATLLPDFPPGGLVKLQEWLPDMTQLAFFKSYMLIFGLTVQVDPYEPHLVLSPGNRLLANVPKAKNWTAKRDAYAQPGWLPERNLAFRFGSYGQVNALKWAEDEHVLAGYGDGSIAVADEVLPADYELAVLPFAATEDSPDVAGLLRILNFEVADFTANPISYNTVEAKPRLTLRGAGGAVAGKLITTPQVGKPGDGNYAPPVLADFTTVPSYFASAGLSLLLDGTVLSEYWQDLRAMLDESRYLTERYRLTAQDVAELDYTVPIWDAGLGDYLAVSVVSEFDPRRPTEVKLCRLNAKYLPAPALPGTAGREWYEGEFYNIEFY